MNKNGKINQPSIGSQRGNAVIGLLELLAVVFTLWGVFWSFYQKGVAHGLFALSFPPYAWYRGAAPLWEEPSWKKNLDSRSEEVALLIMYSTSDDPAWQVKSRTLISDAKSWVSSLPTTEKVKFKQAAESFKHAFILYSIQVGAQMASGKVQNGFPIPEEAIKTAESFNQYQGLNRAWLKVQEDYKKYSELSNQLRPDQKKAVGTESKKQIQAKIEFMNLVGESMKHKTDQTFREIFG